MCHESDYEPSENDIWTVTYLNNGFYQIKQRGTNMCLDVSDGSIYRNANVQLYTENMTNAQQWSVERSEHGYTLQARCSGFYLDIFDTRIATGTNVQVYTGNGETWQSWCFIPCNNDERPIEDGTYTLHTVVDTNYSLDASGIHGEYKNGSNVQIWNDNSDPFIVKYIGNGWYKLYEESSGLALDIDNDSEHYMYNNRNAQLYQDISTRAQLWRIRKTSDGHYFLISKLSGYYLDLSGGNATNGNNVAQYQYNGSSAQKWDFVKVVINNDTDNTEEPINDTSELTIEKSEIILKTGEQYTVNANQENLTYKTNNSNVALVSKSGVVTAIGKGSTIIFVINEDSDVVQLKVTVVKEKGDINSDGTSTVSDLVLLEKHLFGMENLTETQCESADLNEDGRIDAFDMVLLRKILIN